MNEALASETYKLTVSKSLKLCRFPTIPTLFVIAGTYLSAWAGKELVSELLIGPRTTKLLIRLYLDKFATT